MPDKIIKIQRTAEEPDEPYLNAMYRSLTAPYTTSTMQDTEGTRIIQLDYSEVLTIASDEWTPIGAALAYSEEATNVKHFWMEERLSKTPVLAFSNQIDDPNPANAIMPTRYENVLSIQMDAFTMTDLAQAVAQAAAGAGDMLAGLGPDEFGRQMRERLNQVIRNQELMILEATYDDSSPAPQFRGILGNYRDASTLGAAENGWFGVVSDGAIEEATMMDLGGDEVTKDTIEGILDDYLLQLRLLQGGGLPDTLFVAPRAMKLLKDAASTKIQITMSQEEVGRRVAFNLGGQVGKFLTAFGMLNIVAHPLLHLSNASGGTGDNQPGRSRFLALSLTDIRKVGLRNYGGVRVEPRAKNDQTDRRIIKQVYTLEVRKLLSHGAIKNFWIRQ